MMLDHVMENISRLTEVQIVSASGMSEPEKKELPKPDPPSPPPPPQDKGGEKDIDVIPTQDTTTTDAVDPTPPEQDPVGTTDSNLTKEEGETTVEEGETTVEVETLEAVPDTSPQEPPKGPLEGPSAKMKQLWGGIKDSITNHMPPITKMFNNITFETPIKGSPLAVLSHATNFVVIPGSIVALTTALSSWRLKNPDPTKCGGEFSDVLAYHIGLYLPLMMILLVLVIFTVILRLYFSVPVFPQTVYSFILIFVCGATVLFVDIFARKADQREVINAYMMTFLAVMYWVFYMYYEFPHMFDTLWPILKL